MITWRVNAWSIRYLTKLCLIVFVFWICSDSDNWVNDESVDKKIWSIAILINNIFTHCISRYCIKERTKTTAHCSWLTFTIYFNVKILHV